MLFCWRCDCRLNICNLVHGSYADFLEKVKSKLHKEDREHVASFDFFARFLVRGIWVFW